MNDNLFLVLTYVFIKLNTNKVYLKDLYRILINLEIYEYINIYELYKLKFNNCFFNFYEDTDGYIITLKNGVTLNDLEEYFINYDSNKKQNKNRT